MRVGSLPTETLKGVCGNAKKEYNMELVKENKVHKYNIKTLYNIARRVALGKCPFSDATAHLDEVKKQQVIKILKEDF